MIALVLALALQDDVTFSRDVAPILHKHCAECHRPGEIGPFPLLGFEDAAKRAKHLAEVVSSGRMPPWRPEPQDHGFKDERRLSDAEKRAIARWAETGAKEGDPKAMPAPPTFRSGWTLGKPDLVLKMKKPFTVPATGRDIYRIFAIPIPIDEDKTVAAVEFHPGNPRVLHHALFFLDSLGQGRKRDVDGDGFTGFGGLGLLPTGSLGGWVPGVTPRFLPEGVGLFLKKGADLVMQVHYHPNGKEETDESELGVYFTKKPAEKIATGVAVVQRNLVIPAGEKRKRLTAQAQPLPADVDLIAVVPHMHVIGREIRAWAELPDGKTEQLIWIKDWDFNWQGSFQYRKALRLPKGTVVKLEAFFDNSEDNPQNPSSPPKVVRWGEQTTDEMCLVAMQFVADTPADTKLLQGMEGALLGAGLLGGGPGVLDMIENGFPIPERMKPLVGRFDKNQDGKIDNDEIDALPPALRDRIRALIPRKAPEEAPKETPKEAPND